MRSISYLKNQALEVVKLHEMSLMLSEQKKVMKERAIGPINNEDKEPFVSHMEEPT